jgi:GntR family transcriptional regulator/MocR family aminotransferase
VIYVGSFSKTLFPALRLGFLIVPPDLREAVLRARVALDFFPAGPEQAVLADFMAGGHYAAHLRRMRTLYSGRRQALIDAFARLAPHHALGGLASGMHATLELPARVDDRTAAARAARAGIRVLPLSRYVNGPAAGNGLLLGYSALPERRIAAAVARLARALTPAESGRNRGR